jgi:hypothetical protein
VTVASVRGIASFCCKKEEEDYSAAEIRFEIESISGHPNTEFNQNKVQRQTCPFQNLEKDFPFPKIDLL